MLYAEKSWSGTDGKYEAWVGGSRIKWNNYQMSHHKWTYAIDPAGDGHSVLPKHDIAGFKGVVGWTANNDLNLLNKLAEKIKGHAFDLGINIAEASKTYGLVLSNLQSIGSALVDLKHGNIPGALRSLGVPKRSPKSLKAKDISGRWLELQYGWRPLVDQAYEAGKALQAATKHRTLRFFASSSLTKEKDLGDGTFYRLFALANVNVRIHAELYEDISLARSLGLVNPAAILWEVVPYSFVVDWFLPVGSYLSAWGVIPALKGRFLTTSRGSWKGGRFVKLSPFPLQRPAGGYGWRTQRFVTQRVVSTSLSVPMPTFKSLPKALSAGHIKNAIALIHQRLG
jgi:hypothetical protein